MKKWSGFAVWISDILLDLCVSRIGIRIDFLLHFVNNRRKLSVSLVNRVSFGCICWIIFEYGGCLIPDLVTGSSVFFVLFGSWSLIDLLFGLIHPIIMKSKFILI